MYRQWHKQEWDGHFALETTPGNATDYNFIEAAVIKDATEFTLRGVGIDRLYQGESVQHTLAEEGIDVPPVGQGYLGQGLAMKEFERRWVTNRIHHGGHPILRWMADNVVVKQDPAGNMKISKPNGKNDPRKVDGIQALVNAIDLVARLPPLTSPPEYPLLILGGRR